MYQVQRAGPNQNATAAAAAVTVYPDRLQRRWSDGISETLRLFDPEGQWEPRNVDIDAEVQLMISNELRKRGIAEVSTDSTLKVPLPCISTEV